MKKTELRSMIITYCDWCGQELNGSYSSLTYPDNITLDFCHNYIDEDTLTCLDKHKLKMQNKQLKEKTK